MQNKTTYNSDDEFKYILYRFNFYSMVVLIPIGIVGNIISLFIFTRPSFNQKTNTGRLYSLLCVVNLITIVFVTAFKNVDSFMTFRIVLPLSTEVYIERILYQCLSWIQVVISVDRFIAVLYPVKGVRLMSKKWILYSIIFGLFVVINLVNSPYFFRKTYFVKYNNKTVILADQMTSEIVIITYNIQNYIRFYIPYFIMVIVDVMVVIRLKKLNTDLNQRRIRLSSVSTNRSSRFTRNTILIDLIYLIFNLPSTFFGIYITICFFNKGKISLPALYSNLLIIFFTLFSFFYLSLIFLLFVVFNKIFRTEFITLFHLQTFINIEYLYTDLYKKLLIKIHIF